MAGGFGLGMGVGAGIPIGQQMGQTMNIQPTRQDDDVDRLQKAKQLLDAGLITPEEFQANKNQILDKI
ncbi:MAG: SHOCT domain-containing protein [Nitrospirota bacterium]